MAQLTAYRARLRGGAALFRFFTDGGFASASACHPHMKVTWVVSYLPWAKPARWVGMRVAGSIWFVPIADRESASGVITSTWLPMDRG